MENLNLKQNKITTKEEVREKNLVSFDTGPFSENELLTSSQETIEPSANLGSTSYSTPEESSQQQQLSKSNIASHSKVTKSHKRERRKDDTRRLFPFWKRMPKVRQLVSPSSRIKKVSGDY